MKKVVLLIVSFYTTITVMSQAGALDTNFGSKGIVKSNLFIGRGPATARKTFVQPDGSLLVVLQEENLIFAKHFLSDGSFDPTYAASYVLNFNYGDAAQDSTGRIVMAGTLDKDFIITYENTERYFKMGFPESAVATAVAVQKDGKIVVAGYTYINGVAHFAVARCFADGRLDSAFGHNGRQVTSNGNHGTFATCIALQADGKIVVGGYAGGYLARRDFALVRYNTNGSRDLTFSDDGKKLTTVGPYDDIANAIAIQPDGKVLLTGRTQLTNESPSTYAMATVRYRANGQVDSSFDDDGIAITSVGSISNAASIIVQSNSKIVIAGTAKANGTEDFAVLRYNNNGSMDASIGNGSIQFTDFNNGADQVSSALLTNGKILVTGWTDPAKSELREIALALYTDDLRPDVSFGSDGKVSQYFSTSSTVFGCTVIQPDGKLIVAGSGTDDYEAESTTLVMARYNADGTYDTTFGIGGKVNTQLENFGAGAAAIALQSDGKIIVGTSLINFDTEQNFLLARYTTQGLIDPTFGTDGFVQIDFTTDVYGDYNDDELTAIAVQSDNKIVAVGTTTTRNGDETIQMVVARCNADGSPDTTFGDGGRKFTGISGFLNAVTLQRDGKIVVAGTKTTSYYSIDRAFAVVRLNEDGSFDQSFNRSGKVSTGFGSSSKNVFATTVTIQPDTKILVGGTSNGYFTLVRYYANGNLDLSFSGDGKKTTKFGGNDVINGVVVQSDGKIVAVGRGKNHFALARYNEDGTLDSSFAINGKQLTKIDSSQDEVRAITIYKNRLYAVGYGSHYSTVGIIAAYRLEENTSVTKALKAVPPEEESSGLIVHAFPNPTVQNFTIETLSRSNATLRVRVIDVMGHIVDAMRGIPANSRLQLGTSYRSGIYYVEVIQKDKKVTIKLVKQAP